MLGKIEVALPGSVIAYVRVSPASKRVCSHATLEPGTKIEVNPARKPECLSLDGKGQTFIMVSANIDSEAVEVYIPHCQLPAFA